MSDLSTVAKSKISPSAKPVHRFPELYNKFSDYDSFSAKRKRF
jgi:hypothetical protein